MNKLIRIANILRTKAEAFVTAAGKLIKRKPVKITAVILAIILAMFYGYCVYAQNMYVKNTFEPESFEYGMNERIAFGGNYMGTDTTADGYYITFTDAYTQSFEDFIEDNDLELERVLDDFMVPYEDYYSGATWSIPHSLVVVKAVVENESCLENWQERIATYNITLHGVDWYGYNSIELSSVLNPELEGSVFMYAAPGEKAEVTFVFSIYKSIIKKSDWPSISKKDMWVNLTYGPEFIDVKLELSDL